MNSEEIIFLLFWRNWVPKQQNYWIFIETRTLYYVSVCTYEVDIIPSTTINSTATTTATTEEHYLIRIYRYTDTPIWAYWIAPCKVDRQNDSQENIHKDEFRQRPRYTVGWSTSPRAKNHVHGWSSIPDIDNNGKSRPDHITLHAVLWTEFGNGVGAPLVLTHHRTQQAGQQQQNHMWVVAHGSSWYTTTRAGCTMTRSALPK